MWCTWSRSELGEQSCWMECVHPQRHLCFMTNFYPTNDALHKWTFHTNYQIMLHSTFLLLLVVCTLRKPKRWTLLGLGLGLVCVRSTAHWHPQSSCLVACICVGKQQFFPLGTWTQMKKRVFLSTHLFIHPLCSGAMWPHVVSWWRDYMQDVVEPCDHM